MVGFAIGFPLPKLVWQRKWHCLLLFSLNLDMYTVFKKFHFLVKQLTVEMVEARAMPTTLETARKAPPTIRTTEPLEEHKNF